MDSGAQLPPPPQPHQLCSSLKDVPLVAKLMFVLSALNYAYFPPSLAPEPGQRRGTEIGKRFALIVSTERTFFFV